MRGLRMTLTRRTPLRAKPRSKGNRAELEVRNILHAHGWTSARRNWQSGGQGGGDIINGPAGVSIEVKHHAVARVWEWLVQCEADARPTDLPLLICRTNGMDFWAVMPADEWDALRELDPAMGTYELTIGPGRRLSLWRHLAEVRAKAQATVPVLRFARVGSGWYCAAPLEVVLRLIREREVA